MSRIQELFTKKNKKVLNVYYTAGFPNLDSTLPVLTTLQKAGADMVELGMPYSDPLADGPVIQHSSTIAIENGMTLETLFSQLKNLRQQITLPVILMGYMNPILQYGFERFCEHAAACGVDGLIVPDLPQYEFETMYSHIIKNNELDFIFLITPETSDERILKIDSLSTGFLYAVSSSSTTGSDKDMKPVETYLQRLEQMSLRNPVLVGFGIKDKGTFSAACKNANGAIIGSAFVKALQGQTDIETVVDTFIKSII